MREVLLLSLLTLSARVAAQSSSVCHVFSYTGSLCGSTTSTGADSAEESCATRSFCVQGLSSGCSANSTQASTSSNSSSITGCIATPLGKVVCDGQLHALDSANNNGTSYQCICDDDSASCPSGSPISMSYSNGSSSVSDIPASQTSDFSFTWLAPTATGGSTSATTTVSIPSPSAMTTFYGTFTVASNSTRANSSSSQRGQAGQAAASGAVSSDAAETSASVTQTASTSAAKQLLVPFLGMACAASSVLFLA